MHDSSYKTLDKCGIAEYVVQRSRFIGYADAVPDEESALVALSKIREEHKTASHHCYAYIIGENSGIMRYQDDNEPSGTAGIPILECLKQKQIVNCYVMVVRYFGGVLLGTGGLARAYGHTASLAVKIAGVALVEPSVRISFDVAYRYWDKLNHIFSSLPVVVEDKKFSVSISLTVLTRVKDLNSISQAIRECTEGTASFALSDHFPRKWPSEN